MNAGVSTTPQRPSIFAMTGWMMDEEKISNPKSKKPK